MNSQEEELFEKFKRVIDPELMVNIVDLGLVYDVSINEDSKNIDVEMTLTSKGCPMGDAITTDVKYVVENEYPEYLVNINLVWEPPWSLDFLTEKGKQSLGRS